jgi:hypothetical protein
MSKNWWEMTRYILLIKNTSLGNDTTRIKRIFIYFGNFIKLSLHRDIA